MPDRPFDTFPDDDTTVPNEGLIWRDDTAEFFEGQLADFASLPGTTVHEVARGQSEVIDRDMLQGLNGGFRSRPNKLHYDVVGVLNVASHPFIMSRVEHEQYGESILVTSPTRDQYREPQIIGVMHGDNSVFIGKNYKSHAGFKWPEETPDRGLRLRLRHNGSIEVINLDQANPVEIMTYDRTEEQIEATDGESSFEVSDVGRRSLMQMFRRSAVSSDKDENVEPEEGLELSVLHYFGNSTADDTSSSKTVVPSSASVAESLGDVMRDDNLFPGYASQQEAIDDYTQLIADLMHKREADDPELNARLYEEPDVDPPRVKEFKGLPVIDRSTRINGRVDILPGFQEAIVVDDDTDTEVYDQAFQLVLSRYDELKRARQQAGLEAPGFTDIFGVFLRVAEEVIPYNKEFADMVRHERTDEKINLSAFMFSQGGVCRHEALLVCYLLERLGREHTQNHLDGFHLSGGSPRYVRSRIPGVGGHGFAVAGPRDNLYAIDPAQGFVGSIEEARWTKDTWPYWQAVTKQGLYGF